MVGFLPTRVGGFDDLIVKGGIERGNTVIISGGCGTGKTIFCIQSLVNGALEGEKGVYISLTEEPDKIRRQMKNNFGWDVEKLEEQDLIHIQKLDTLELVEDVTTMFENQRRPSSPELRLIKEGASEISLVDSRKIKIPFKPDRIVLDSISSLESAFANKDLYRSYLQVLIEGLNMHSSVNYLISETEQAPDNYSRSGVSEFLADGVIVFYNIRKGQLRRRVCEVLKLRCSDHVTELVPYMISNDGIKLLRQEKVL
jgi:KaiC/GvpD/RAD55 family RecA-like ATPase